jgi:hypothetical protein
MSFERAEIAIQSAEFEKLKKIVSSAFTTDADKFLKSIESNGMLVRQFEQVLDRGLLSKIGSGAVSGSEPAKELYGKMPASDQGQMREFYLTQLETVDTALRQKYKKIYRYS